MKQCVIKRWPSRPPASRWELDSADDCNFTIRNDHSGKICSVGRSGSCIPIRVLTILPACVPASPSAADSIW